MQHNKICQQSCDFIEGNENYSKFKAFLGNYKSGTNYHVLPSKMRQDAWASEVEIISLALLTGKDIVCYYNGKWEKHLASGNVANPTVNAFYLNNSTGSLQNSNWSLKIAIINVFLSSTVSVIKYTTHYFSIHS